MTLFDFVDKKDIDDFEKELINNNRKEEISIELLIYIINKKRKDFFYLLIKKNLIKLNYAEYISLYLDRDEYNQSPIKSKDFFIMKMSLFEMDGVKELLKEINIKLYNKLNSIYLKNKIRNNLNYF